ncbi:glycosyltransferase family 4 protein [Gloeobacter kilaueensis]|uniref:Glycosyl transferase group 1 n=1 Tax=Gloeobacter kilaueensis (strain ATCC BAA-2537 / CCAP 1431/1 / ULC 316 / JS1) TaxID=1183438 RepID=U5QN90_GLOK1|nr:glycosyltransferase family 1 protein [Gloeobacter kilaueensis]AGY60328.1 glycosyl transferase group 1 [Gloeobacter kilaueensis JS1]
MLLYNLAFLPREGAGLANYALNLLAHLELADLTVLAARKVSAHRHWPVPARLSVDEAGRGLRRRLVWNQWQLPKLYKQLEAQLLFCPIPEAPLKASCRSVVTVHDLIPLHFPGCFPLQLELYYRYYLPAVLRRAEQVLAVSEATARDLRAFFGLAAHKITVIPPAHDSSRFFSRGLPPDNYFLYLGRADLHKNLERLLRAFALVSEAGELRLVGTGRVERLVALAGELGVAARVQFMNYVPAAQLPALIERAQALVMPSLWEGFGLPVLEAMACGTPVITSNCASLPEVAGDAALLVDPLSIHEIAAAMRAILGEAGLRERLKELGLERAGQFSWSAAAQSTGQVLSRYL